VDAFKAKYLEIEPREIVHYLLSESAQDTRNAVNVNELLEYLGLEYVTFDFDSALPDEAATGARNPRALLSFHDRLIATDRGLIPPRERFSTLHEVAHYVLPSHQYKLFLCDDLALSGRSNLILENEANELAADLLFQGDRFTFEANSLPVTATSIKSLATKYQASFEATARRMVEKNVRPCMLISFKRMGDAARIDADTPAVWKVRYCIGSPPFVAQYFADVEGTVPSNVSAELVQPYRDVADSVRVELPVSNRAGETNHFCAEFFYNQYNVFGILTPAVE